MIVALPAATAVTRPCASTVATLVSLDTHVKDAGVFVVALIATTPPMPVVSVVLSSVRVTRLF